MTKERFLRAIQKEAHLGNAKRVWDIAVNVPEDDKRWSYIYAESYGTYELVGQFAKYFGVTLAPKAKIQKKSQVERLEKRLAEAKLAVVEEHLKKMKEDYIKRLEAELEKARELER